MPSKALHNLWNVYNLRRSPFFQETLGQPDEPDHTIDLFVARKAESNRMLSEIGSGSSSRQIVAGPPGLGKTTLVQYVKAEAAKHGYLVVSTPVSLANTDNSDRLLEKLLSYVYEALVSHERAGAIANHELIDTARQIVRVFKFRDISAQLSILGSGAGGGVQTQFINPQTFSAALTVPSLLRDLIKLAKEKLKVHGIIVHINNVENMTSADQARAGLALRDIRDLTLMEGYHYILAGTADAIREIIQPHAQLRSVFGIAKYLKPLTNAEFRDLLERRYDKLRLDPNKHVQKPVEWQAIDEVYKVFRGDLRGTLRALDHGAHTLLGYGSRTSAPIAANDLQIVLQAIYLREMEAALSPALFRDLRSLRKLKSDHFTQKDLIKHWQTTQSGVSMKLTQLQEAGFITTAERTGRETHYHLTGSARLALKSSPGSVTDIV